MFVFSVFQVHMPAVFCNAPYVLDVIGALEIPMMMMMIMYYFVSVFLVALRLGR